MDGVHDQLTRRAAGLGVALLGALAACGPDTGAARAAPAHIVDSIVPRDVALARFRDGLPEVTVLTGGAPTRDALVRTFVAALERGDTATLQALVLNRAEFAWLYYPPNPQGLPPYDLAPGLMWFMLQGNSDKGLRALLAERAGRPLGVVGYRCDRATSQQGENVVTGPCEVRRVAAPGDTIAERLFGLIVERGGRAKFVSYANKL